jgi:hypothetical protein
MIADIVVMASDGVPAWILAAGPAGAVATYWSLHRYYRNTDKSHAYERDTLITAQLVQGDREKVRHISRTRDSDIDGDNSSDHRQRVQRLE